ncbi:MAG: two-component regulator propeller domain-containing protein [Gammaproteobacteria bacterium]
MSWRAMLLALWTPLTAVAMSSHPMLLDHLGSEDGLPQGTVYASLQDSTGFMWFGTEDGLVRYDGNEIHRYAFDPTIRDGLPNNFVFQIVEDRRGDLWVAMKGGGVAHWHRATDTFTTYAHVAGEVKSLASDQVRTIIVDPENRLWIGTLDAGIDILDPRSGHITHLRHQAGRPESLIDDQVYSLLQDRRGEVWVGTNGGIDRWTFGSEGLRRSTYLRGSASLLAGQDVQQIVDGNDGTLWAATFDTGVYHLDYSGLTLRNIRHSGDSDRSLSSNEVHALLDDHEGNLWIGTAAGLDCLNRLSGKISHYTHDKSDLGSLSDSFVMSLYEDRAGLMWIGTRAGGVDRWNSRSWNFGGSNPAWLDGKLVTAFADAPDDNLWVGTLGGGLYKLDARTGAAISLDTLLTRNNALGDGRVMSLAAERSGGLWIGTWGAGLKKLNPDGQLTTIPAQPGDAHSLSAPGIAAIVETRDGRVWIATHGGGANILNPATGLVQQLPHSPQIVGAVSSDNVTAFLEDPTGFMWIGTDGGGLNLARADGTVIHTYTHDASDPQSLSANTVYGLSLDADGRIWVATDGGGLDLLSGSSDEPKSVQFRRFWHEDGLTSDTIYAAVPDQRGQLWLSGNSGLMRFDPRKYSVTTFHREHGLQSEEFNSFAYFRTRNGRMAFGGTAGFNIFDPARLSTESAAPTITMTGVEVLGAPVHTAVPNWLLDTMSLDYRSSVVSFDFAVLDFKSPKRNRLAYRMSGLTEKWIDLHSLRRVTLTNLDAGDHTLEVRAANADSHWSTTPFRLKIHKAPAPWLSTTAYLLYVILAGSIIVWGVRSQRARLRRALMAQQQLESEVALRTSELREANQQLIVAGEAKSDFLSRMSHELRTPMNGVLGMTELLARAPLPNAQARQVNTIRSSAQTLLQILNNLLDLSKAQAGKIQLESLQVDLTQLLEETVAMFSGAAEAKRLSLTVCPCATTDFTVFGDALRIRQILMNLIGNALKFTERGEVVVTCDIVDVDVDTAQRHVRLTVADTGVGISANSIRKIFDPFTQADETTTRRFGGTGLGLSICQQLVELMGGTIEVTSQEQRGSTFTVNLPLRLEKIPVVSAERSRCTGTIIIMTRRTAFAESLSRYAVRLGWPSRVDELGRIRDILENDVVIVDADGYPAAIELFLSERFRHQALFCASTAVIAERQLEGKLSVRQLLRSPVSQALLEYALLGTDGHSEQESPWHDSQPPPAGTHVLVVEDDAVNATVAEGYLSAMGCTSVWVVDGKTAIARQASERFDLILLDLNMPGLDGYQTAQAIRSAEPPGRRVPIVALTANSADAYREACLLAGMDDIMSKPYTFAECTALMTRWTDAHAAQPQKRTDDLNISLAVLDPDRVANLSNLGFGPSLGLFGKLVALFRDSAAPALEGLSKALALEDFVTARSVAHRFKGAAANVGAIQFAHCLSVLEECCARGEATPARHRYAELSRALPLLLENLEFSVQRKSA